MNQRTSGDSRFLSVAVQLRCLTVSQAREIAYEQRRRRRAGLDEGSKAQDLAVTKNLLSPGTAQMVYQKVCEYRTLGIEVPDVLIGSEDSSSFPTWLESGRHWLIAASVPVAVLTYVAFRSRESVIAAIVTCEAFAFLFEFYLPLFRTLRLNVRGEWHKLPARLSIVGVAASLTFMIANVMAMRDAALTPVVQVSRIEAAWHSFLFWFAVCVFCSLVVLARGQWRKRLMGLLEVRLQMRMELGSIWTTAEREFCKGSPTSDQQAHYIRLVLDHIASIVQLNSWDEPLKKLRPWRRRNPAMGAVCAWYLVPSANGRTFDVVEHSAPGVDAVVDRALHDLRGRYHPVFCDEQWCWATEEYCRKIHPHDISAQIELFRNQPGCHDHTSLAGVVYARKTVLSSRDPDGAKHFDDSFATLVDGGEPDHPFLRDLLKVTAFAAASVNAPDDSACPFGVIVIWKKGLNGKSISLYDDDALTTATRVLSGIIQSWREHQNAVAGC